LEAHARAADDLRQTVRTGLGGGDYTLLFLWIRFWLHGGGACVADLDAFLQGPQALSDNDAVVLGFVVDELQTPPRSAELTHLHRRSTGVLASTSTPVVFKPIMDLM
jgi:hypothetical protein